MTIPGTIRTAARDAYAWAAGAHPGLARTMLRARTGRWWNRTRRTVRGHRNVFETRGAILDGVTFDIQGDSNRIRIAPGCRLKATNVRVRGCGCSLTFGAECQITDHADIWLSGDSTKIDIGRDSSFDGVHLAAVEAGSTIRIGEGCLFAYGIEVRTSDSHRIADASTGDRVNPAADVSIGDHVWVGVNALFLKGSHVAADSVVGAAAVVTRTFGESGVVIAGNPASVVRRGVVWHQA